MSNSYDELQPLDDPLKDSDHDNNSIIEYDSSDTATHQAFEEDPIEYTEEMYLDMECGENVEAAIEPTEREESNDSEEVGIDDLFHCSSCDVDFHSVTKHIEEFHSGHEVFVDDGNEIEHHYAESEKKLQMSIGEETQDAIEAVSDADKLLYQKVLQPLPIVNCKICGIPYAAPKGIAAHMRTHVDQPKPAQKKLKTQKKKPTLEEEANVSTVCEICNTIFTSSKGLK